MNISAIHEAGHAVAIHLLNLADVLKPGGAAVRKYGGGIVALDCTSTIDMAALMVRFDCGDTSPCEPVVMAARERADLVPKILMFLMAGYGATSRSWSSDFETTVQVRRSADFETARKIISDLIECDGWTIDNYVSEIIRDVLDRAVLWTAQPHVRELITAVAAYLDKNGAATWAELQTIFSSHTESAGGETLMPPVCAFGEGPLIGAEPGTVADIAQPATVENNPKSSPKVHWTSGFVGKVREGCRGRCENHIYQANIR